MPEDDQRRLERWGETYERRRPIGAAPLAWQQFSVVVLEKFVPRSNREELCRQIEWLRQGDMSVTQERVLGATFDEVVDIARQIKMVHGQERVEREARGLVVRVDLDVLFLGGHSSLGALPVQSSSRAPPVQGSSMPSSSTKYPGAKGPPPAPGSCFECGELGHIWRQFPHLHGGLSQQRSQPPTTAPVNSPPAQHVGNAA
ncbi:uncharacterized protein [Nicotiana tomentosiformis]|uniref:uncharacterized protein n=1 Tax=Nicotiana tomentosiformis TaxID=4098 RepID=UPI00388CDAC3